MAKIAWWKLDDVNVGSLVDSVGGHTLTNQDTTLLKKVSDGNPSLSWGRPASHLANFSSAQAGGRATNSDTIFNDLRKFTVRIRYKPFAYTDWQALVTKGRENTASVTNGWLLRVADGIVVFSTASGAVGSEKTIQTPANTIPIDGNYYDIAVTYDETVSPRRAQIYVNGRKIIDNTTTFTTSISQNTTEPLALSGQFISGAWARSCNGHISDCEIYDEVLTESALLSEAASPSQAAHKNYFYKVYEGSTHVGTWTKEVISEPKFRSTINGGPGELRIILARPFDDFGEDVDVTLNNKVECYVVDKDSPNGTLMYSGYISGYKPVIDKVSETVEVTVLGFVGELGHMILRDSAGNTTLTYNSYDPSQILTDVLEKYIALGGRLRYSASSVALTNTVVSYTFNTNTIKECLDKIIELCPVGWYYKIDPNGLVYLQPRNILADHTFRLGIEVERLETFRRIEDLVNRVLFTGGGSLFNKYENTASQLAYGLYEDRLVDQRVTVGATAETISQRIIDNRKDPEIRSKFTIIDNNGRSTRGYNIESIKVGQTLKIKNLNTGTATTSKWDQSMWDVNVWDQTLATSAADVIQILSIEYTADSVVLEASSRLPQIAKRIEDVNRNLELTQTVDNPAAPS